MSRSPLPSSCFMNDYAKKKILEFSRETTNIGRNFGYSGAAIFSVAAVFNTLEVANELYAASVIVRATNFRID